jgi:hypothetical protein
MRMRKLGHVSWTLEIRESCNMLTGKAERTRLIHARVILKLNLVKYVLQTGMDLCCSRNV